MPQNLSRHCNRQRPPPLTGMPWIVPEDRDRLAFASRLLVPYTISTLIPVELAGSFGDGRCCHPSGYLQIDGIRRSGGRCHLFEAAACAAVYRARPHGLGCPRSFDSLAPSSARPLGPASAGSIQAFPKALYCLAHHQNPFANSTRLIVSMVLFVDFESAKTKKQAPATTAFSL